MLQQIVSGLEAGSWYGMIALAVVVVMKATDVPNFAMADMGLVSAYVAWGLHNRGMNLWLSAIIAMAFGFVFGAVTLRFVVYPAAAAIAAAVAIIVGFTPLNYAMSVLVGVIAGVAFTFYAERRGFRTLAGGSHFPLLLSTIGIGAILVNSIPPIWGVESHDFEKLWRGKPIIVSDTFITRTQILTMISGVTLALVLAAFFRSPWGVRMRAIAENRENASLLGISPSKVSMLAWGVATVMASAAMILQTQATVLDSFNGEAIIFSGFVAAVIGGFASLPAAFVGGLLIGVLEGLAGQYISTGMKQAVALIVVLVVLLARPQGLGAKFKTREV